MKKPSPRFPHPLKKRPGSRMNKAVLLPLASALVFALVPALPAQNQAPAKPLTESELLKTLDGLGKGDPVTKTPLGAADRREPAGTDLPRHDAAPKDDIA